jgi:hydrogenase maturation protease
VKLLVIGYGNELRGDDGVGPRIARAVDEWALPDVTAIVVHTLTPELAEPISRADAVVFVDACVEGEAVELIELKPGAAAAIGHTSEPRWLLGLSESLWGRRPRAWLITVPGVDFEMGHSLSPQAERGMTVALQKLHVLA